MSARCQVCLLQGVAQLLQLLPGCGGWMLLALLGCCALVVRRCLLTLQVQLPAQVLVLLMLLLLVVVLLQLLVHSTQLPAAQKSPVGKEVNKACSEVPQQCHRQRARGHGRAVAHKLAHPQLRANSMLRNNDALQHLMQHIQTTPWHVRLARLQTQSMHSSQTSIAHLLKAHAGSTCVAAAAAITSWAARRPHASPSTITTAITTDTAARSVRLLQRTNQCSRQACSVSNTCTTHHR
jgi:hypothetical protein